jgi:hypothetical protein
VLRPQILVLLLMCAAASCRSLLPHNRLHLLSGTCVKLSPSASLCVCRSRSWLEQDLLSPCTVFLGRALLASRTGLKTSDTLVRSLLRNVIQIGLFATIWALAGLATYFLLPQRTFYTLFDMTSGSIYTHVGGGSHRPRYITYSQE